MAYAASSPIPMAMITLNAEMITLLLTLSQKLGMSIARLNWFRVTELG